MFSSGIISQPLIETLEIVKTNFPIYKSKIQLQLINLISRILCEVPYFESYESSFDIAKYHKEKIDFQKVVVNESTIILAWKTLSSFDFTGFRLNFLVESALRYLEHEVVEVRKTASVTVASLISRNTAFHQTSSDTLKSVSNIVEKLVKRMNLDPEYRIRETIFLSLDKNVDSLLATPENIKFLFFAANDNFFEVRNLSIKTICRISKFNPSLVLPRLRKNLIKILYQLEFSTIPELKEDSSKILTSIVQNVQVEFLMRYVDPLSKSLIANVNSDQVGVASTAMECLGELFEVAASLMADKIDHLITVILHSLQSSKKLSALKLLGKIAGSAGITTGLYVKYPSLLNIFIDLLKNNQSSFVKKEVAICMGRIGAYDPSLVSLNSDSIAAATSDVVLLINLPKSDEFYAPTFCIRKLMEILVDSKLDQYHLLTIQTVMTIFKTLGSICSRFTGDVIPTFFLLMKSPAINSQMLNFYFQQLTQIILIVKIGMTPYIPELMTLVFKYWNSASNSRIIYLIDAISKFMIEELKEYFPTLIPKIFEKFESKNNYDKEEPNVELKLTVFEIIIRLSVHLDDYTNIIIPVILQVLNDDSESVIIQAESIKTLGKLFLIMELDDQLSTITLNLINILKKNANTQIQCEILESFYLIAVKSKFQFEVFIPLITDVLNLKNLSNYKLEELFFKIKQKFDIYEFDNIQTAYEGTLLNFEQLSIETSSKLSTNQTRLKKVWQVSNFNSDDDWYNWFRSFSNELLLQSPSQSLRACSNMANIYFPFAKELFNVAFLSCWNELNEANKKNLVSSLELTLNASSSLELLYAILNLAEFMEQDNKPLPISTNVFAAHSLKCHAYAKALYYKERDFLNHPDSANIDSLINIYNFLDLTDSSIGIIRYHEKAKTPGDLDNKSYYLPTSWYEKLNKWDDGLVAHERNLLDDESFNVYSTRNSMNFFSAFGEWSKVLQLSEDCWNKASLSERKILSPIAASAAWANEQFNLMEKYTETMSDSADSLFFNSILALKNNMSSADAMPFIDKARDYLVVELEALIGESYSRAYSVIVRLQMLAQLEEIISFGSASAEKQKVIATIWNDRLSGCQKSFDIWQKMLRIRSIVIKPKNDLTTHIKFSTLCRKSGKLNLASKSLLSLLNNQPANGDLKSLDTKSEDPRLVYAICKHLWESSTNGVEKINIIKLLKKFCGEFSSTIGIFKVNDINQQLSSLHASWKINLLSKIFTKLGDYSLYLQKDNFSKEAIPHITSLYGAATKCSSSYSSNNKFALANLEAINFFERNTAEANLNVFSSYVISALKGFSKSILLSHGRNSLQDTLRFLSLWFKYGHQPEINEVVVDLISLIPLATWLQVIPQLIARIDSTSIYVKGLIQKLLMTVGRYHPQALVYSLSVTSKSEKPVVRSAALTILNEMSNHSSTLIEQALVFGNEMIAVSMLWREIWCEGLLEALFCYRKRDIDEMIFRLDLLHKETDKQNPKTQNEIDFV
ncbi:phosphatidylinositol kinase- protein kinase tor1 [Clydaea vesicula]|uniref:Serine/threonine-protein kinase TOR n=1 Tax=Clydaea vesicula TaxID=447962 RepID=A0AAD5XXK5_9FUNG|nr:phosphatidylinositol kinase- protein kinase tor1 [Clydaea vesicula]